MRNKKQPKLSALERSQAEEIYSQLQCAQTRMWNLSLQLEKVIGCAVDTTNDLTNGDNLDSIIERNEPI